MRDLQLRWLVVCVPVVVALVLVGVPAWSVWLAVAGVALLAVDAWWLTLRIQRQAARGE